MSDEAAALVCIGDAGDTHEGFIALGDGAGGPATYLWLRITGVDPRTGSTSGSRLEVSPALLALLGGGHEAEQHVCARLRAAPSPAAFAAELQELLERLQAGAGAGTSRPLHATGGSSGGAAGPRGGRGVDSTACARLYARLLEDLDRLGWEHVEDMDEDASRLTLLHRDGRGRLHRLRVALPPDYPASPPATLCDLPAPMPPLALAWDPRGGSGLELVAHAFAEAVASHQLLWCALEDLDRNACVVDPPPSVPPERRHVGPPVRRVALGGHCSLQLALDPARPMGPPREAVFMGPAASIAPLQAAYYSNLHHAWVDGRLPSENLSACLGMALPRPAGSAHGGLSQQQQQQQGGPGLDLDEEMTGECAICYSFVLRADGESDEEAGGGGDGGGGEGGARGGAAAATRPGCGAVPDSNCPTPACGRPFHRRCLGEWLRSLPETTAVFGTLFGRCPYCSNPISVRQE